jgi:thiamine biosynthesis lipoprotein
MWADGYATALSVLGPEAGMAFAERHGLAVLMVVRGASGFEERYTPGFGTSLVD